MNESNLAASKRMSRDLPSGQRFNPRSDDIYIATYPRSGTTLMQMMLYQMNTNGEMDFRHIDDVIPFYEKALRSGQDLNRLPSPRVFKTHLPYRIIGRRPGRFIYGSRCGKDVLISYFHLYKHFVNATLTFESFFDSFLSGDVQYGSWFRHVLEWEEQRGDPNILFLRYEDVIRDLDKIALEVAALLRMPITADILRRIGKCCQLDFMRQHEEKFQPSPEPAGGPLQPGNFLRQGRVGGWKEWLSSAQREKFDDLAASYFTRLGVVYC